MGTLISLREYRPRAAQGNGLGAMLARASNLFLRGGLPEINAGIDIQSYRSAMECRLSSHAASQKIGELDFFCGVGALDTFCLILENPPRWLRRNFRGEYQKTEDARILKEAGYTALFFFTYTEDLTDFLSGELRLIGSYLFDMHFFFTGKPTSLHLKDNFETVRDALQRLQTLHQY